MRVDSEKLSQIEISFSFARSFARSLARLPYKRAQRERYKRPSLEVKSVSLFPVLKAPPQLERASTAAAALDCSSCLSECRSFALDGSELDDDDDEPSKRSSCC